MENSNPKIPDPIIKSPGLNKSEKYLTSLCDKTFLSLWSNPNLYYAKGKELADLLVVFGNNILIFSDKLCKYPTTTNPRLNWNRWFRAAITKSAGQLWGAERRIRKYPKEIFFDKDCKQIFPFDIDTRQANIHLILVARGVSDVCKKCFGGSGSLMINNEVKGISAHTEPFIIGDIESSKTFIHVLDDTTLDIVMNAFDTISDLVGYLSKKEILLRSKIIIATGEEDLLPCYMTKIKGEEHDFDFPENLDGIGIIEGTWRDFCNNPQRKAQIQEDKISYFWDYLIERFNVNTLNNTQYMVSAGGIKDSEKIMRFFASESRFKRRIFSKAILGLIEKTPASVCGRKFIIPLKNGDPYYVFIVFPKKENQTEQDYRSFRGEYLKACCMICRANYPEAKDIVGLATESGKDLKRRSEDAIYLDGRCWDDKMQQEAKELQVKLNILINPTHYSVNDREFPNISETDLHKIGRNEKCPCGSSKKYKKCHGQ